MSEKANQGVFKKDTLTCLNLWRIWKRLLISFVESISSVKMHSIKIHSLISEYVFAACVPRVSILATSSVMLKCQWTANLALTWQHRRSWIRTRMSQLGQLANSTQTCHWHRPPIDLCWALAVVKYPWYCPRHLSFKRTVTQSLTLLVSKLYFRRVSKNQSFWHSGHSSSISIIVLHF